MFVKHVNFGHKLRGRVVNRVTDLIIRDFLKYLLTFSEAMFGYLVKSLRIERSWETWIRITDFEIALNGRAGVLP